MCRSYSINQFQGSNNKTCFCNLCEFTLFFIYMTPLEVWEQLPALSVAPVQNNSVPRLLALEWLHNLLKMTSGQAQKCAQEGNNDWRPSAELNLNCWPMTSCPQTVRNRPVSIPRLWVAGLVPPKGLRSEADYSSRVQQQVFMSAFLDCCCCVHVTLSCNSIAVKCWIIWMLCYERHCI